MRHWWKALLATSFALLIPPYFVPGADADSSSETTSNPAASGIENGAKKALDSVRLPPPVANVQQVLRETEAYLRPPTAEETIALIQELTIRGHGEAAKRIQSNWKPTDSEFDKLVKRLLALGQFDAATSVLGDWRRKFPRSAALGINSAVHRLALGEFDLAAREVTNLLPIVAKERRPLLTLVGQLAEMGKSRRAAGVDANPWAVRFIREGGKLEIGKVDAAELKKIPIDAAQSTLELVRMLPLSGNLWALLGDVLSATGDIEATTICYRRAKALGYTPRPLLERLQVAEQALSARSTGALAGIGLPKTAPAEERTSDGSASERGERKWRNDAVLLVGGAGVLVIAILQIRQWMNSNSKRPA